MRNQCPTREIIRSRSREAGLLLLLVCPSKESSNQLQHLKLLRIGSIEREEVQEMIRNNMTVRELVARFILAVIVAQTTKGRIRNSPIDVVLSFAFLEESQGLSQMVIQYDRFMPQFANQKIFLLDLLLEWRQSLQLVL